MSKLLQLTTTKKYFFRQVNHVSKSATPGFGFEQNSFFKRPHITKGKSVAN
jgi:hypothetical protein